MSMLKFSPSQEFFLDIMDNFTESVRLEKTSALLKFQIHEIFSVHSGFLCFICADLISCLGGGGTMQSGFSENKALGFFEFGLFFL